MKLLAQTWDVLFGALLIGGAPWVVIALSVILGDLYERLFQTTVPDKVGTVACVVMFITAFIAFAGAIQFRVRRRILPVGFVILEAFLGVAGALVLFVFYGVLTYSIIG
jgi:hypothetical protein